MSALRTTSLLSIKPAYVKAGEVVVPVMIHVGEWAELSATPGMWDRILAEVAAAQVRAAARKPGPRVGQQGQRKTPKCTGCDYHGCADCVASDAARRALLKPSGKLL